MFKISEREKETSSLETKFVTRTRDNIQCPTRDLSWKTVNYDRALNNATRSFVIWFDIMYVLARYVEWIRKNFAQLGATSHRCRINLLSIGANINFKSIKKLIITFVHANILWQSPIVGFNLLVTPYTIRWHAKFTPNGKKCTHNPEPCSLASCSVAIVLRTNETLW